MLTDKNKALLHALEAKYVTMLGMISDIGKIDMGDAPEQTELEKYILSQQQKIHEAANILNYGK